jgi:hypothetical protein
VHLQLLELVHRGRKVFKVPKVFKVHRDHKGQLDLLLIED